MKGIYRHFKGGTYEVLDTAIDANTEQHLVIYRPQGSAQLWVRTLENFNEMVEVEGRRVQRFAKLSDG